MERVLREGAFRGETHTVIGAAQGIGNRVALPHMKQCPYVKEIRAVFGRASDGIEFSATDGDLVHLFFLILIPPSAESEHVQVMRKMVTLSRDRKTVEYLVRANNFDNLKEILAEVDEQFD